MKTQQECWQALIDGEVLEHVESEDRYEMREGRVVNATTGFDSIIPFITPRVWRIAPKKLPFCDALRALVAGECKQITDGSQNIECVRGYVRNSCDNSDFRFMDKGFDKEWELVK